MNGAPRKIHRKQGMNVTQVASRPPSVPRATEKHPRIAIGAHEPDELQHHDQWSGRRLGHAETVEHLGRAEPVISLDRLLRDIGEHRIGTTERHHRHGREEGGDLAEHIGPPEEQQEHRTGASHSTSQTTAWRSD
jgi:hypothetical protein